MTSSRFDGYIVIIIGTHEIHPTFCRVAAVELGLTDHEITYLWSCGESRHFAGREHLIRPNVAPDGFHVVLDGVVREYVIDDGRLITVYFCPEGDLTGTEAIIASDAAPVAAEAIVPVVSRFFHRSRIDKLKRTFAPWPSIAHRVAELSYLAVQRRVRLLQTRPARRRVEAFLASRPSVIARVPQHLVAEYLNVEPETLSRIRAAANRSVD